MQKYECLPELLTINELNNIPVFLNECYCWEFGQQHFHYHEFIEICYIASGGGYHQIQNKVMPCSKGDIYILNTGIPHAFFMSDDFIYTDLLVKNLAVLPSFIYSNNAAGSQLEDLYRHFYTEILTGDTSVIKVSLNDVQFEYIEQIYKEIESEYHYIQNGSLNIISAEIIIFLTKLTRYIAQNSDRVFPYKQSGGSLALIEETCRYIEDNYGSPDLTIASAAASVYTGKSYLSRIFKKYLNQYFSDYLLEFRIGKACEMLAAGGMSNEQIAHSCGFMDIPTFYKNFKRITGYTPKQLASNPERYEIKRTIYSKRKNFRMNYINDHDEMTSTERVRNAILGIPTDRTPIYGWLSANLNGPLTDKYGSVENFEDKYGFDAAHIFGGPGSFNGGKLEKLRRTLGDDYSAETLVDKDIFTDPDHAEYYGSMRAAIAFHKKRGRFCYVQTPGFFENFNNVFSIEEQLMNVAAYPEELGELYRRQVEWTKKFAARCLEAGADMVHVSDDWGAQKSLLFSPVFWREYIKPCMKSVADFVHSQGSLISLHSDGCVAEVADEFADIGLDCVHPWQESAGMSYMTWLEKYRDKFAILGGICIQTTLGFGDYERLEREIRRVFSLLKNKRWICCTTHFVQEHCSLDELKFAYDLIYKLARE